MDRCERGPRDDVEREKRDGTVVDVVPHSIATTADPGLTDERFRYRLASARFCVGKISKSIDGAPLGFLLFPFVECFEAAQTNQRTNHRSLRYSCWSRFNLLRPVVNRNDTAASRLMYNIWLSVLMLRVRLLGFRVCVFFVSSLIMSVANHHAHYCPSSLTTPINQHHHPYYPHNAPLTRVLRCIIHTKSCLCAKGISCVTIVSEEVVTVTSSSAHWSRSS